MAQASIIINVSELEFTHYNGLSGQHVVPSKKPDEQFGILIVYPTPEIQDIGDERRTIHWLKSTPLAKDIAGMRSDDGNYTRFGVLLCEAEPELSKELLKAIEDEIEFLNENPPDVKYKKQKDGIMGAINVESDEVKREKVRLSNAVQKFRQKFERECRSLVTREEVAKARQTMLSTYAQLVSDGDTLWAGNEIDRRNISELAKRACRALGLERPWCYAPVQQFPCPGCGKPCRENVITCGSCGAVFDRDIEAYAKMSNAEKARALYPERYTEPEPVGKK
jgi:hypothetical protein